MTAQVIDGRKLAVTLRATVAQEVSALGPDGIACRLATLSIGDDDHAKRYERRIAATAADLGVGHTHVGLAPDVTQSDVIEAITALNEDTAMSGILILRPVPDCLEEEIFPARADEGHRGVHPENPGLLAVGRPRYVSSTAAAVFHVLVTVARRSGEDSSRDFYHHSLGHRRRAFGQRRQTGAASGLQRAGGSGIG